MESWPESITDVDQLEDLLSRPTSEVVETLRRLAGDILVLGAGGKIGPTLARMARRASDAAGDAAGAGRRVIAVARFSDPAVRDRLTACGVETVPCDLLDRRQLAALPEADNVLYLPAMKFGSTGREATTWAMNTYLAGTVCERFPSARIVAYSTGNVYPLSAVGGGGSRETDPPGPVGEYAMSALGRERLLAHFSEQFRMPIVVLRLNYAHEARYGIMVDLAQKVLAGRPVDVTMGYFNAVWQGDSNAMTLRAFDHVASPPRVINIAGGEELSVRAIAQQLGRELGKPVTIEGSEARDALLSDGRLGHELLGRPAVSVDRMIRWIAGWLVRGGPTHGKPTHFQTRDGKF